MYQRADVKHLLIVMETLDGQIQQFIQANRMSVPELEPVSAALQDRLYALGNHLAIRALVYDPDTTVD